MSTPYSVELNPPEILRKIELLQRQIGVIEKLNHKLKIAEIERRRLEDEIQEYRSSVAPIRKCPEEILSLIFEFSTERGPKLATRLLPVCRHWYNIAINSPRLWNHVDITAGQTWDQQREKIRNNALATACLQRSGSLPLHITLDLKDIESESMNLSRHMAELLQGSIPVGNRDSFVSEMEMFNLWGSFDTDIRRACRPGHIVETISMLIGEQGEHMSRWGTVHIILPSEEPGLIRPIWQLFCASTPNLHEIYLSDADIVQRLGPSLSKYAFPDLSSLEKLHLDGEVTNLDFLPLHFRSIKNLRLVTDLRLHHQTMQLSRFKYLEYLAIGCGDSPPNGPSTTAGQTGRVKLPHLRELRLHLKQATMIQWEIPVLRKLKIVSGTADDLLPELPDVRTLHLRWRINGRKHSAERKIEMRQGLAAILSKYTELQTLSVRPILQPIWNKFVRNLGEKERSALPMVVFE